MKRPKSMSAGDILKRVAQTYARCSTYHAVGTIDYPSFHDDSADERADFRIRFSRPDVFSFESKYRRALREEWEPLWLRCEGSSIRTNFGKQRKHDDLREALSEMCMWGAASSAEIIAPLLMPGLRINWRGEGLLAARDPHLLQIKDLSFVGEEMRNGLNCFLLNGSLTRMNETTLWISARDFSIVRIRKVLGTAEEAVARDKATAAREVLLAEKLGRQAVPVEEYVHRDYFVDYQFNEVSFDESIDTLK